MEGLATAIARIERSVRVSDAPEVSLGFLHKTNPIRAALLRAVTWPGTDWVLLILILLNAAALGSQDPTSPNSSGNRSLFLLNVALNVVFTAEMLAKIAAFGLWGPGSYIADKWNWSASGRGRVRVVPCTHFPSPLQWMRPWSLSATDPSRRPWASSQRCACSASCDGSTRSRASGSCSWRAISHCLACRVCCLSTPCRFW